MMKRNSFLLFAVFILLFYNANAQYTPSFSPFKGFHVGVTGQAEFIQKSSFVYLTGSDPAPKAKWTYGWETGIEFSYHFAKYFGISAGINYGTVLSYISDVYMSSIPDGRGGWKEVNEYEPSLLEVHLNEVLFPLKLEFHYPLAKNLFFMAEAGIKIKGLNDWLVYKKYGVSKRFVGTSEHLDGYNPDSTLYYYEWGEQNTSKIRCNLLLGLGLYYQLPYGDLLRFSAGLNISFNSIIEGYYEYCFTKSYGTFAVKNDFIYTQLSYIHTLNFQKAKRYLKSQDFTFSSKKERRGKILDLLNER